jgi:Zn-dependent peptidase ImmA (M78 family)
MTIAVQQGTLPVEVVGRFLNKAPVDLLAIAQALGLQVETVWFDEDHDAAGKIERSGQTYTVSINALDNARRQRFTLAHEIAHYVLHRDLIGDGITDRGLYRSRLSDAIETQANRYAANLLMPAALVRTAWRDGNRSLTGVAELFNVSTEAARIRLQELGLGA